MTRFSVNLSILFTELPLERRAAAAAESGFSACEFWWPFASAVPADREVEKFIRDLDASGLRLTGLNFAAGDMPAGDRGLLSRPRDSAAFRDNIDIAVDIARRTGCQALNALYGNRTDDAVPEAQDELALENLALAARAARRADAVVLVEPLNSHEAPHYPLTSARQVVELMAQVPVDNLRLLADFYHLARMGEGFDTVLDEHFDHIGHVQIADVPGRGQPGTGDFDFPTLFGELERRGYPGWIGLEYRPTVSSHDSFGWIGEMTNAKDPFITEETQ